jgi:polyketide cyclase/dehydrase/lipid transport protein
VLRNILIGFAALILVLIVIIAIQPSAYRVERTAKIAAPQADLFSQVNDFHKWDAWSPWAKLDPAAKITFAGPESGQGAVMNWAGNDKVGEGKITILESRPSDLVTIKVDFIKPFIGTNTSQFAFAPEGDQTIVTWTMSGERNFIAKAFCLAMNGEKMMGNDMEKGLAQMKSVAERAHGSSN